MTEYLLKIRETKNTKSLLNYLQSLDFVSVIPKKVRTMTKNGRPEEFINEKENNSFSDFLNKLPETEYLEEEVVAEIKKLRNGE